MGSWAHTGLGIKNYDDDDDDDKDVMLHSNAAASDILSGRYLTLSRKAD